MKTARHLALLFLAGFTAASAQTYTFTTLAGYAGVGSADGPGSSVEFDSPGGVAMDGKGNVFVADTNNHTIRKIAPTGIVTTLAGLAGFGGVNVDGMGSAARFYFPSGVTADSDGNVFVADTGNDTIRKITADGVVTTLAGSGGNRGSADGTGSAARFNTPNGVAVDRSGNVFVADSGNGTIRMITANGVVTTLAGLAGSDGGADGMGSVARFRGPFGVAVDRSGNVFVADNNNHAIRKITPGGLVTTLAGSVNVEGSVDGTGSAARFAHPKGVAVDDSGNVFVAQSNHTIRKITAGGVVTTLAGSAGSPGRANGTSSAARFNFPFGLAVDGSGKVCVADTANHTIRIITAEGVVTTLAGDAGYGSSDGTRSAARFANPRGVAVDGSGNVFVADTNNHTLRKITADGVVTTLAGLAGHTGSDDGTGSAARFNLPYGVAVDGSGNAFVADTYNHTIRKITAGGIVTTLAGTASSSGTADGIGSVARFNTPYGVAVDGSGNVFVADTGNSRVRKITADGVVTTVVGTTVEGYSFSRVSSPRAVAADANGNVFVHDADNYSIWKISPGGVAGVIGPRNTHDDDGYIVGGPFFPASVAVDGSGNVFVPDGYDAIRKITAAGVVTTHTSPDGRSGSKDGAGNVARFSGPQGIAVDGGGNVYIADTLNNTIRKGVPAVFASVAHAGPQSQHVNLGASATFTIVANASALGFQWKRDGVAITGATGDTHQIGRTAAGDMGFYSVVVTGEVVTVESPVAILTVATGGTSRLSNFSARGLVPTGSDLTVGFAIRGGGGKSVLVRAIGPTLGSFGVSGALTDPRLDVFLAGASIATGSNDDWSGGPVLANAFASVGAFPLAPASKDAAVLSPLAIGAYSARVTSSLAGGSGIVLTEVYDRDAAAAPGRLINISALSSVGASVPAFTLGFVIDGTASKQLLIRAVGPGLTPLGVAGVLGTPQLSVIPLGKTFTVASNETWGGDAALASAFASAGAFALPAGSKDAAVVVRLPPGGYTVTVSGVADTTGRALVEIYDLDP